MKSNITITPLKTWTSIPSVWESRPNTINYNKLPESDLYDDGWRDVVVPSYDSSTQKLGALEYDDINHVVTYPVIEKTQEEIESELKALVPFSVTKLQAMVQMVRMGIKDSVLAIVAGSGDEEVQLYFEHAATWERASLIIASLAPLLNMSEDDLDTFFIEAEKIS